MISIKDFSFSYKGGESPALKDLSLEIQDGEFIGVIGPGGAGKSTLTYALNGVIPKHHSGDFYGSITVNGLDTIDDVDRLPLVVGSLFQDIDAQMISSMVEDEILFGLENFSVPKEEIESRISWALSTLHITDLRQRSISTLSGGQKQKVAIAAILALKPSVMVLDEPTGELDPQSSRLIFSVLKELNISLGMTVIVVEQKIMLQCEFADKLLHLNKGRAVIFDTVENVLEKPELLEKSGVNCPRIVTLAHMLRQGGLYSGKYPKNIELAAEMVRQVIS